MGTEDQVSTAQHPQKPPSSPGVLVETAGILLSQNHCLPLAGQQDGLQAQGCGLSWCVVPYFPGSRNTGKAV